jgi:N6-adenosine-specific RNA methylase IME4
MKLVRYDAACRAIAEATRVDDVKVYKDKAVAMEAYARQIKNPQLEADAWVIRKRAEDKLGELSAALEKEVSAGPGRGKKGGKKRLPTGGKSFKTAALKVVGISTSAANRYEKFNKLPAREKERRIAKGRAAIEAGKSIADTVIRQDSKKERRAARERELSAKILALPTKKYGLIVTDDAWNFKPYSYETGMDRHAANHYTVEKAYTAEELHERTKDRFECAAKDCVLAMWATVPHLAIAIDLLRLRGFRYKSHVIWRKIRKGKGRGTGYWFINEHELMLIGVRGNIPAPAPGTQWPSVIEAPVGKHSAKPEKFLEMLEEYFPTLPKIEFNRRGKPRPGWDAWGLEAEAAE